MTAPDIGSFFGAGGGKSLGWKDVPIGTTYTGIITSVDRPEQSTDPATGLPAVTRQQKPRMQSRISLQTDYRDPSDPDDDGSRNLYANGVMAKAIGEAIKKAGLDPRTSPPQAGATLSVRLVERESNGPGVNPTNKFDAHYVPPSPAGDFFGSPPQAQQLAPLGGPQPQVQQYAPPVPPQQAFPSPVNDAPPWAQAPMAPQQVVQQVPSQVPAAQPPVMTPEQIAAFMAQQAPAAAEPAKPAAISQQAWDAMPLETKKNVAATMASVPAAGF
jgi:hypothetical protein